MTILFVDRTPSKKRFDSSNFIGARIVRGSFYETIGPIIHDMLKNKSSSLYYDLLNIAYEYSDLLLFEGNYSEAYKNYHYIYCKLMYGTYMRETQNFINDLDKIELYYNLGVIAKDYLDNFDDAMYFFGEAGKEYSRINNVAVEEFFRNEMIDKPHRAFWSFSSNIDQNCFGHSAFAPELQYKSIFGNEPNKATVEKLLKDFTYPLLLQFIFTFSSYFKWLPLDHNIIKGARITRVLGEISWLFECYLKQKLNSKKMLSKLLDDFVKDKPIGHSYEQYKATIKGIDNIMAIEELLNLQKNITTYDDKQSICLLITYLMRNYTAHNFDDQFHTFRGDEYTKKIFVSCLMSFFIVL